MNPSDELLTQMRNCPAPDRQEIAANALASLSIEEAASAVGTFVSRRPSDSKESDARQVSNAVTRSAPGIGAPSKGTRDTLWTITVVAFAIVLCGSFATLACGVFLDLPGKVSPELVLSMFTSVVGFLAGLFVANPSK